MSTSLFDPVSFAHGRAMPNRFMLAPLTNQQSHEDGTLSDEEFRWLTMRAVGGFGLTMTCASHVQASGKGFPGQLGCFGDQHVPGLARLATAIKEAGSLAFVQLHHAGRRSPSELIGQAPVSSWDDPKTGARAMTTDEVDATIEAFVAAAVRARDAGYDGIELHGAHDYLLCQFLSAELNQRADGYGGSIANRARPILDAVRGIRDRCGEDFTIAVRLSPERFGLRTAEIVEVYSMLVDTGEVDLIDMSLWDVFKEASDEDFAGRRLLDVFAGLDRGNTRLAVAGKIYTADDMRRAVDAGADIVAIGRAAITNHDVPSLVAQDPDFAMRKLPVSRDILRAEGLSESFIGYMANWPGFVAD